jgi:cell shape-determining protein MreC
MGWMAAIDRLTEQVTNLAVENMGLRDEIENLKKENQRLLSELKKSEELADMLATRVFEQEEE